MAAVVVYPLIKLMAVFAARAPAAISGLPGAMVMKAPMVAALAVSRPPLSQWRAGITAGRDAILPESFMNATMDPVKVMPPERASQFGYQDVRLEQPTDKDS